HERLGVRRAAAPGRRAGAAAVHHGLGHARGRPRAPGRPGRAALPLQACPARRAGRRRAGRGGAALTARRRRPAARKTRPAHKSRSARKTAARKTAPRKTPAAPKTTAVDIGAEVARLGTTLAGETDFAKCLDHLLTAARRVTGAEAGTVYVRRGDMLEFAAVQNEVLERRIGAEEMRKRLAARPLSLSD